MKRSPGRAIPGLPGSGIVPVVLSHAKPTCTGAPYDDGKVRAPLIEITTPERGKRRYRCRDCGSEKIVEVSEV